MIAGLLEKFGISLPPLPSTPPTHEAQRGTLLQLAVLIGFAVIMHFKIADPRIGYFAVIIYALKLGLVLRHKAAPNRLAMMLLTIVSLVLIIAFYGGWNGQRAGISFLVLLVALKFLESRGLRDYFVVCLILYFLAASSFLFDSSILSIVTVVIYTLMITSILLQLSNPTETHWSEPIKVGTLMVVKALPIAIILFLFFPRIQGSFGFLPSQDRAQNPSELADNLVAGDIAQSAFNNSLAFRVIFDGEIPSRDKLYWRAKVMPNERGFHWEVNDINSQDRLTQKPTGVTATTAEATISYQILHEKSADKYLPYLDTAKKPGRGQLLNDFSVVQTKIESSTFSYSGISSPAPPTEILSERKINTLLQRQSQPSAKMQVLLTKFRDGAKDNQEIVARIYQHFENTPFKYSLMPPSLNEFEPMEDFLFGTQTGYCEHYASAFTILARWSGIPARVVVGYQGGRIINTSDSPFLEVRYSDAHAWSEVWLDGAWIRVDPTATISPERIEFGMDALMELWDSGLLGSDAAGLALSNYLNPKGVSKMLRDIQDSWRNITYQWNKWVLNYNFQKQQELLAGLGFKNKHNIYNLVAIMFGGAGLLLLFYFWRLIPRPVKRSEAQTSYLKFVAKFSKHGLSKYASDSPNEFAEKARQAFPHLSDDINKITDYFQQIRYGQTKETPDKLLQLKRAVRTFKIYQA